MVVNAVEFQRASTTNDERRAAVPSAGAQSASKGVAPVHLPAAAIIRRVLFAREDVDVLRGPRWDGEASFAHPIHIAASARPTANPAPAAVAALSVLPSSSIDCAPRLPVLA